ncbi:MAG: S41 family peptidase [Peptostreptococcaceae bacterium]|nr:S41 family peptidase [Peptostreptococcaceae bacterium]
MKKILSLISIILIINMNILAFAQDIKYSKAEYIEDLEIVRNILESYHGNLYENISKKEFIYGFNNTKENIKENMNVQDFNYLLSKFLYSLKDGHTSIDLSEELVNNINLESLYLPLKIKFIDNKIYSDYNSIDIPAGSLILEINDIRTELLLQKLEFIAGNETDNHINYLAHNYIENDLPYLYPGYFEPRKLNKIRFVNSVTRKVEEKIIDSSKFDINNINMFAHSNYLKNSYLNTFKDIDASFDMKNQIATLRIYSFEPTDQFLFYSVLEKFFEDVKIYGINDIIIDLRGNLGGNSDVTNTVLSYILDDDFYTIKKSTLKNIDIDTTYMDNDSKLLYEDLKESYTPTGSYSRNEDGSISEEGLPSIPFSLNNYDGNVYCLIDGGTFSFASIFAQKIKDMDNGYLIGTSTSGNYYETTAGSLLNFNLPNTKIQLTVPIMQLHLNDDIDGETENNLLSVKPNYEVPLNITDFVNQIDTHMDFTYELIKNKRIVSQ